MKDNNKNNIKEGKGTMNYNNGDKYIGEWKNDKREGKGKIIYKDNSEFDGEWKENIEFKGKGKIINKIGIYEGEYDMIIINLMEMEK